MLQNRLNWSKLRKDEGAAMVEFAIACSLLIMLVLGICEFGLIFYQKQVITNASREAARYGVTYVTDANGVRLAPQNITTPYTITQVVTNYCTGRIATGSWSTVVSGAGYATGTQGSPIIVTVTSTNQMDLLSGFIPSLKNLSFTAQTTMNCE
ncbi:MAG: TadE/TadG family type IV pilus assembly protein [Desulfobaccales bacterium]